MRILAVTPYYAPEGGGLERYAHEVLRRLAPRHEVRVVAARRAPPPHGAPLEAGPGHGAQAFGGVAVERYTPRLRLGNTPLDLGLRKRLQDRIRRQRPDVVWAHTPVPFPAEMAYLASRREGVPFALTYHAGRLDGSTPWLSLAAFLDRSTLERSMLRGSAGLMAVGPYVRDHALGRHRDRVSLVPPGVDASQFKPVAAARGGNGKDVLFVGPLDRSYRWKGLDVLLQAFRIVRKRHPDSRLVLVGSGDRLEELRRRAMAEGLVLPGRLDDAELLRAYQSCAVTCLPSTTDAESFGMVLAEANACGRPVVGSRVGGIPDFVREGDNGLLARPGDPNDLAYQILSVLGDADYAAAMGRRGRARVVREHAWDDLAKRTERVLLGAAG